MRKHARQDPMTPPFDEWAKKADIPSVGSLRPGLERMLCNSLTLRAILANRARSRAYFEGLAADRRD